MATTTSYYLYERYEKRGDQDWIPSFPNVFSKDGDGTMPLYVRTEHDEDCGWHCDTEYRWVDVPIEEGYVCDDCELDIDFRWVSTSAYTYFGDYRYEILKEQFRKDNGEWNDTDNIKYGNPVKVGKKLTITMSNGDVFSQSCGTDDGVWHSYNNYDYEAYADNVFQHSINIFKNNIPVLTGNLSKTPTGVSSYRYGITYVKKMVFGSCVKEIGWRYRNDDNGCGKSYYDNDMSESGERMSDTIPISFSDIGLRELVLPEGLRWIGNGDWIGGTVGSADGGTFSKNKLTSLTLPSSVESIGYLRAFDQDKPSSSCMSRGDAGTFSDNYLLKNLSLNEGLKSIGDNSFAGCLSLERVEIPSTVEKMGINVFSGCLNLKQIIFKSQTPPDDLCVDDSAYYTDQCRNRSGSTLYVNDDVYIYIPCGTSAAYASYLNDVPSDRIVEYGGACGDIPTIESMYDVLYSYRVGTATTNVYRLQPVIDESSDFYNIDEWADEIIIPSGTTIEGYGIETMPCGKLVINGTLSWVMPATTLKADAREIVVNTDNDDSVIYGGSNTEKVTIESGCTPLLWGCFSSLNYLKEVHIDGNATLKGGAFANCHNLKDVYITYDESLIDVVLTGDTRPFHHTNPTVHVPCELYDVYRENSFWGEMNIVRDTDECEQTAYVTISSNTFTSGCSISVLSFKGDPIYCGRENEMVIVCKGISEFVFEHAVCGTYGRRTYLSFYKDGVETYSRPCSNTSSGTAGYVETYTMSGLNDGEEHIIRILGHYNGSGRNNYFTFTYN